MNYTQYTIIRNCIIKNTGEISRNFRKPLHNKTIFRGLYFAPDFFGNFIYLGDPNIFSSFGKFLL